jgi:hypothetical protein
MDPYHLSINVMMWNRGYVHSLFYLLFKMKVNRGWTDGDVGRERAGDEKEWTKGWIMERVRYIIDAYIICLTLDVKKRLERSQTV